MVLWSIRILFLMLCTVGDYLWPVARHTGCLADRSLGPVRKGGRNHPLAGSPWTVPEFRLHRDSAGDAQQQGGFLADYSVRPFCPPKQAGQPAVAGVQC